MRGLADRIAQNESEQARQATALTDSDFDTLLDAYADLWLASAESARTQTLSNDMQTVINRGPELLRQGTISNITATQWEESSLAIRSRILDLELRKLDATTKLHQYVDEPVEPSIEPAAIPSLIDSDGIAAGSIDGSTGSSTY